jgi:ADP-ribose pyrophosphatase YjhB (NUDIX family)
MTDEAPWDTRVTAFAIPHRDRFLLFLRHRRLGVEKWELPGGHVEGTETLEEAAARETVEETGVEVRIGRLVAMCWHEWPDRHARRMIFFFAATPRREDAEPQLAADEPDLVTARWIDPAELDRAEVSPFLHPLIDAQTWLHNHEPFTFRVEHRLGADGSVGPVVI